MKLETFKNHYMLRPEQTVVINRPFELDGEEMHLLALTYKDNSYTLWVMDCLSEEKDDSKMVFDPSKQTNRESHERSKMFTTRSIESLEVGEHIFEFNRSSTESFQFPGDQSLHKLQYFIEQGIELSRWDNVPLSKMQLTAHMNSESVPMVNMSLKDELLKLKFRTYHKEAEVFYKYSLNFNLDAPVELKYNNPFEEKDESFYVQGFEIYNLEKYVDSMENNDKYKDVPKEDLDRMIDLMTNFFEDLKRKNSSLVLMTYEADIGLSFQSTGYLDKKIEKSSGNSSRAMGFIFKPDEKTGEYGKKLFVTSFQDVPNDKLDIIEFELHSVSKIYPEKIVMV
ncbi:hypothetical protein [Petrocella sp. FN5]|uniref:hypothetical protein n=1 Tax=Petrocella sp. FN5 TaxID=3032002 RepID=UPI0023DA7526|nr:hypothetical protein [Petrocella sp. FN5]MDF1618246.1 hypothetical protein [Petrocella sp. FN5]